jgi:cupin superfamily acireductone dioxygenase involved in methionine salvage
MKKIVFAFFILSACSNKQQNTTLTHDEVKQASLQLIEVKERKVDSLMKLHKSQEAAQVSNLYDDSIHAIMKKNNYNSIQ